jgi:hypothetical protein
MNTKRLAVPFEVKEMDDESRTFSGLASTWDMDLGGDVIRKGAFKRTVGHWKKGKRPLPLVDQHRYDSVRDVVGKLVEAEETDAGLDTTWQVIDGPDRPRRSVGTDRGYGPDPSGPGPSHRCGCDSRGRGRADQPT